MPAARNACCRRWMFGQHQALQLAEIVALLRLQLGRAQMPELAALAGGRRNSARR